MAGETSKISLLELNRKVKEGIQGLFPGGIWVVAEISDMSTNQSGHCYLELIEKSEGLVSITARAKATIWSFTFRMLRPYFESVTGQRFAPGIKVLVLVSVEFHELYGFSLNVKDIEPSFTLGDLARRKKEIIDRLTEEGVIDLNKELELPLICKRIAVISSETAAGYGDFTKQLKHNNRGFKFKVTLFQATMQGEDTERSVIHALERIFENIEKFDIVVIIRGGGSQAELNFFNNYNIAFHITQFPLPVFTGIGHDRDQTIADMVAHTSLKTPTAVAEYILSVMEETAQYLDTLEEKFISMATEGISERKTYLNDLAVSLRNLNKWQMTNIRNEYILLASTFEHKLRNLLPRRKVGLNHLQQQLESKLKYNLLMHRLHLNRLTQALPVSVKSFMKKERVRIQVGDTLLSAYNPVNILKRGYSVTYLNGKSLKLATETKSGDTLQTRLAEGCIDSIVK